MRAPRCEGYRRYGGAFTFGPVRWERCKEDAVVLLTMTQEGKESKLPSCLRCWKEARDYPGIVIKAVDTLPEEGGGQ